MPKEDHMTEIVPVHRASFWVAAVGFLLLSIGSIGVGWVSGYDRLDFSLQVLGLVLIAVALLLEWRTHVERRGWAALIFFVIGILLYSAVWIPYVIYPANLGTASANQLGFLMSGVASLSVCIGIFAVMWRKESQLRQPINSGEPQIKATFIQLSLFGVGMLLQGVDLIWVGEENSNHAQFSLPAFSLLLVLLAVFSFRDHLSVQLGSPAVVITLVAIALYTLGFVLHALPPFVNEEWRLLQGLQGIAYALGALACVFAAQYKAKAFTARVSSR